jgi:hypothetical protein
MPELARFTREFPESNRPNAVTYGRGGGVGRDLGTGVALGVGVGVEAHGPGTTTATSSTDMLVRSPKPS